MFGFWLRLSSFITLLVLPQNVNPPDEANSNSQHRPLVVSHRGAVYQEPENTLNAFKKSADLGCDGIELDVFLLRCGTLVVFHGGGGDVNPGCLQKYCGVEGSILNLSYDEARKLTFTSDGQVYTCPRSRLHEANIPTLEDVLLEFKCGDVLVKIELKGPGTEEPVLELVERLDMVDLCHFASFAHERVERIRRLRPERRPDGTFVYRTACLFPALVPEDFIKVAKRCDVDEVHLRYDKCTKERVERIHEAGMGSMAWFRGPVDMQKDAARRFDDVGNEDAAMYQTVLNTGVQAICVNKPDVLLNYLEQRDSLQENDIVS